VRVDRSSGPVDVFASIVISDAGAVNTFTKLLPPHIAKRSSRFYFLVLVDFFIWEMLYVIPRLDYKGVVVSTCMTVFFYVFFLSVSFDHPHIFTNVIFTDVCLESGFIISPI